MALQVGPIVQDVFTVKEKFRLTPHLIRVILKGNVEIFKDSSLGANNKIFIPQPSQSKVEMRDYNFETKEWIIPAPEVRPFMRTYTHRAIDFEKQELTLDFADHGTGGPASAWANRAQVGDELGIAMKTHSKELFPPVDWYLLAGDMTAIPVLSVILESLPATAKGTCIIEVHGPEDEQQIKTKAEIDFIWLHNAHPENGSDLVTEVKKVDLPSSSKFAYVASEFSSVKDIRTYLRKEQGWEAKELYAFSYWKSGASEDESGTVRREEKESV